MPNNQNSMDIILNKIGELEKERFTNYKKYTYRDKDEILLLEALKFVKHKDLKKEAFTQHYNFTITNKKTKESTENILERAITLANNSEEKDSFYNQYPFDLGQHIDLVYNKTEIIELKQWDNKKDSPLFALIEILKYYSLLKNPKHIEFRKEKNCLKQEQIKTLTILAPLEYYENFRISKDLISKDLKILVKQIEKIKKIKINFECLDLDKDIFIKIKKSLEDKNGQKIEDLLKNKNKIETDWTYPFNQKQLNKIAPKLLRKAWTKLP